MIRELGCGELVRGLVPTPGGCCLAPLLSAAAPGQVPPIIGGRRGNAEAGDAATAGGGIFLSVLPPGNNGTPPAAPAAVLPRYRDQLGALWRPELRDPNLRAAPCEPPMTPPRIRSVRPRVQSFKSAPDSGPDDIEPKC